MSKERFSFASPDGLVNSVIHSKLKAELLVKFEALITRASRAGLCVSVSVSMVLRSACMIIIIRRKKTTDVRRSIVGPLFRASQRSIDAKTQSAAHFPQFHHRDKIKKYA